MKRKGWVGNSSSSSFIVDKHKLSPAMIEVIHDHLNYADLHLFGYYTGKESHWEIEEKESQMRLSTGMDHFDMRSFLREIGVPDDAVEGGR